MWQNLLKQLSKIIEIKLFIPDLIATIGIIAITIMVVRTINKFLIKWHDKNYARLEKHDTSMLDAFETRSRIIRKLTTFLIYFFSFAMILLQYDTVRSVGIELLASAGVAGIVIGLAAQSTLSNIMAGITISISQPVRLNDAVIYQNDFGWIEEIRILHTIIRTWDSRRIVVPNSILANTTIQNWTMRDPSLLGIVMMYVDYTCDVNQIKEWVKEIVNASTLSTEERVAVVQVVDFTEKTMQLRILSKAANAPSAWGLRCEIREKLIEKFKQTDMPLPRIRLSGEKIQMG